ncbi:unnamed protein product [Caenorhabditis sp. 36 PRJEB53466]|nr:unnamed protein product [Caenorhabditis sp. 36 PRJEB53466]
MERANLSRFILEGICTSLSTTKAQISELFSFLLIDSDNLKRCDLTVNALLDNSFISRDGELLSPTQLGRAAIASSLPPEAALAIFDDLNLASRAIALDTELHMLYLVTPINVSVWQECDWHHLFALFSKLPPDHRRIAKLVGASEKFILEQIQGRRDDGQLQVHTRFFSALALFDLINEVPIYEVSHKYRISRGCLQTLQSQSATYSAMIVAFCLRLGWTYLKALLDGFAMRLMFGIRSELSELVAIEGIDGQRARILHEKGITCLSHLSACEPSKLAHFLTLAVPYSSSNSNDGLGEWLFGEPRMRVEVAAMILKERARIVLQRRILELGIHVELPKHEEQESCDSGLPDSCTDSEMAEQEEDLRTVEEMTKSVTEMSLVDTSSDEEDKVKRKETCTPVKMEEGDNDVEVEETVIECLETSLLRLKASKDEVFLRRLSQTFSPARRRRSILNDSLCEDSFDRPVPGSIPISFKTPLRNHAATSSPMGSSPYFEDSFDRPVPGSMPLSALKSKRQSFLKTESVSSLNSSIVSENKSFDVFATPPIKEENARTAIKHGRITDYIDSPLSAFTFSPILKHAKLDPNRLWLEDVCYDVASWKNWIQSAVSAASCSVSVHKNGVAVSTGIRTAFIPLIKEFGGVASPNPSMFATLGRCVIPLESRLQSLRLLMQSVETFVMSMEDAFYLFDEYSLQIARIKVIKVEAHLNHLIECEKQDNSDWFPMLLKHVPPEIQTAYAVSQNEHKTVIEAFAMKRIFESLQHSAILCSSKESVRLEMSTCQTVLNMFYAGISFDQSGCSSFVKTIRNKLECLEEEIWRFSHGKFNLDSPYEVSNVLFHRLGLVYPETSACKTKQRHFPTNKAILEQLTEQHVVVGKILEYRHIQHTLTQCLLPLEKCKQRIHCWFEMCTMTGRIMTIRPNLQNVPKRVSSEGMSARQLFITSPGTLFIGADYKQLELRVLAHLSQDPILCDLIAQDRDLFGELATEWKFPRDAVKQLCYGLIYGMGAKSLAELTKMKVEEAEKMLKTFFSMFPKVRSYINETKEKAAKEEHVATILGRKKMIKMSVIGEEKARMERVAVNYTIQGSASEIFKTAMIEIEKKIKEYNSQIVLTIHDEVLVESPIGHVATVSDIVRDCMQCSLAHLLRVPMRVSLKTGPSWAGLK